MFLLWAVSGIYAPVLIDFFIACVWGWNFNFLHLFPSGEISRWQDFTDQFFKNGNCLFIFTSIQGSSTHKSLLLYKWFAQMKFTVKCELGGKRNINQLYCFCSFSLNYGLLCPFSLLFCFWGRISLLHCIHLVKNLYGAFSVVSQLLFIWDEKATSNSCLTNS